jgi:hypothetical protein
MPTIFDLFSVQESEPTLQELVLASVLDKIMAGLGMRIKLVPISDDCPEGFIVVDVEGWDITEADDE